MMRLVRDLAKRLEFHAAGTNAADESEQGILTSEINTLYLTWGLVEIDGLEIDGRPASTACMIEDGPETLCHEIIASVKSECFLSEDERKN